LYLLFNEGYHGASPESAVRTELCGEAMRLTGLLREHPVEAAIAWVHATAQEARDTDWGTIVSLYDELMVIRRSPVVALNRAIAVAQREGPQRGLEEIRTIAHSDRLGRYPYLSRRARRV
jgi:predicted RNA polymerase sigma factor